MTDGQTDNLKDALEEFLSLYDIKLSVPTVEEKTEAEVYGNYSEIMSKTQEKLDEFNAKAEEILQNAKMTREEMEAYSSDPKNFTPEQWDKLRKLKEATEELKKKTYRVVGEEHLKKTIEKERKKQYHRFGKKKNWIAL